MVYYDVLRCTTTYYDVLRRITTYYHVLRRNTYCDVLRRTTTYDDVLRRTTTYVLRRPPQTYGSHNDASHSRQPLVKCERLVCYEVNAVMRMFAAELRAAWLYIMLAVRKCCVCSLSSRLVFPYVYTHIGSNTQLACRHTQTNQHMLSIIADHEKLGRIHGAQ